VSGLWRNIGGEKEIRLVLARRNPMVWIKSIRPDENPIIKELYDYRVGTHGYWPNVLAGQSLKPEVLKRMMAFQDLLTFGGSSLGRRKEELISFHVSALNECQY
jgi:hypothetical protein